MSIITVPVQNSIQLLVPDSAVRKVKQKEESYAKETTTSLEAY